MIGLSVILVLAAGAVAIAAPSGILTPGTGGPQGIVTVGPVNPSNGFPDWYRDTNGVDLSAVQRPAGQVLRRRRRRAGQHARRSPSRTTSRTSSSTCRRTPTALTSAGGNNVLAEFDLEGAFANGGPTAGDQIVFSRIRYRINGGLQAGHRLQDHAPVRHGHRDRPTTTGAFFVTQDVGVTPGDFSQAHQGPRRPVPDLGLEPGQPGRRPAGRLHRRRRHAARRHGQRARHELRAHPGPRHRRCRRLDEPEPVQHDAAPTPTAARCNDCIQTNNFVLVGKKSTTAGVDVTRATYDEDRGDHEDRGARELEGRPGHRRPGRRQRPRPRPPDPHDAAARRRHRPLHGPRRRARRDAEVGRRRQPRRRPRHDQARRC